MTWHLSSQRGTAYCLEIKEVALLFILISTQIVEPETRTWRRQICKPHDGGLTSKLGIELVSVCVDLTADAVR
jgi:hypothetical protein